MDEKKRVIGPKYLLHDEYKKLLDFYEKYVSYSLKKPYFKGVKAYTSGTSQGGNKCIFYPFSFIEEDLCYILKPSNVKWFNHYKNFQYVLFNLDSSKKISSLY